MIIHKTTGKKYQTRLEAKLDLGSSNYNKCQKNGEFTFIEDKNEVKNHK